MGVNVNTVGTFKIDFQALACRVDLLTACSGLLRLAQLP
eukprot:COSAG04_NODE_29735_length_267_cov_0.613095_2_plen_38_part_01